MKEELNIKYCKTKELDLEKLLRVIISICKQHDTPCNADVTIKLDDYPNPVRMVLSEVTQKTSIKEEDSDKEDGNSENERTPVKFHQGLTIII